MLFDSILKIVDKVIPDPVKKAEAQQKLLELQQNGELKEMEIQMSAILAEAGSGDKWTSRARPSFMYVVYILLLWSIPMGFIYAFSPATADNITLGFKSWLNSIPADIIELFKWVMLGYIGGRSMEKIKGIK